MTNIIIDGYNVIGTAHRNIEKARNDFIDLMMRYKKIKKQDITVVFDGHKAGQGHEQKAVLGGVTVIYSGLGERADDVIKRIVSRDRKEWLVVSSDREIARHAWSVNAIAVPSDEFIQIVSREVAGRSVSATGGNDMDIHEDTAYSKDSDEDSEVFNTGKGNPHKLSKKEKSVRRALSKL
ncbi:MAG: NYN domain-containing protein [Nitrospirae bacterium]|nr:NYN domain-containing protein [Nitrospirota bacterium]